MSHPHSALATLLAPALKLPGSPPEPPPGDAGTSRVFRAADAFRAYRYLQTAIVTAVLAIPLGIGLAVLLAVGQWVIFGIAVAIAVLIAVRLIVALALVHLDWELRYYVVTDRSLRIREGAWTVRELTLTFLNVQNVSIEQGPLQRLFGISNVVVQTAGGGGAAAQGQVATGHQATLRGITHPAEVRDLIRARLEAARRDAGLGDADDAEGARAAGVAGQVALLREIRAETSALADGVAGGLRPSLPVR